MSATGTKRSLVFTPLPPASDVRETREADRAAEKVADDPQEAVLLCWVRISKFMISPGFRNKKLMPGRAQRCPCCLASWADCPCTSVMCPNSRLARAGRDHRPQQECIDHCHCRDCRELRAGGVAAGSAAKGAHS